MYGELDRYLTEYLHMDFWYDEGFSIAREILVKFTNSDWHLLFADILSKPIDYKRKLAYCVEDSGNGNAVRLLLLLAETDDSELFETCVDSLRGFLNSDNKQLILADKMLINKISGLAVNTGIVTKKIFLDFLAIANQ